MCLKDSMCLTQNNETKQLKACHWDERKNPITEWNPNSQNRTNDSISPKKGKPVIITDLELTITLWGAGGGGGEGEGFLLPQSFQFVNSFPPLRVGYFGALVLLVSRFRFLVIYPVLVTWRYIDENTTSIHIPLKTSYIGDEHFKRKGFASLKYVQSSFYDLSPIPEGITPINSATVCAERLPYIWSIW